MALRLRTDAPATPPETVKVQAGGAIGIYHRFMEDTLEVVPSDR
jgi:hypothetical protein